MTLKQLLKKHPEYANLKLMLWNDKLKQQVPIGNTEAFYYVTFDSKRLVFALHDDRI